jgi:hypothetical protein
MLLRSIIKHIKDQNWFAVVLDFFIVVVGILIAFQITDWDAAEKAKQAQNRYLTELARDLSSDVAELREGKASALARLKFAERILIELDPNFEHPAISPQIANDAQSAKELLGYAYAQLTTTFIIVGSDYTFDELIQSGELGVLSNRELVNQLTSYYGRLDRKRTEFEIGRTQVDPMLDYLRNEGLGLADRVSEIDAINRASKDSRFLGFVKMAHFLGLWQYTTSQPILENAESTLAIVQAEIKANQ